MLVSKLNKKGMNGLKVQCFFMVNGEVCGPF